MKNPNEIYQEAYEASVAAANAMLERFDGEDVGACGFGWVEIRPARGKLVNWLKANDIGSKGYNGGWHVWNPSGARVQNIDVKEAGAHAFAEVLRGYGIDAVGCSRMD